MIATIHAAALRRRRRGVQRAHRRQGLAAGAGARRAGRVSPTRCCSARTGPRELAGSASAAAEIARQLGLAVRDRDLALAARRADARELRRARASGVRADPCWEMSRAACETDGITLSGLTGESLRTNYPRVVGLTTVAEAETAAFDRHRFGRYHYVRRGRARRPATAVAPALPGAARAGRGARGPLRHLLRPAPAATLDRRQARPVRAVRVPALFAGRRSGSAMASGWEARARACVPRGARAALASSPIADISVRAGDTVAEPGPDERVARSGASVRPAPATCTRDELTGCGAAIREAVEFDAANPAFELVDRDAMLADADRLRRARSAPADRTAPRADGGPLARPRSPGRGDGHGVIDVFLWLHGNGLVEVGTPRNGHSTS